MMTTTTTAHARHSDPSTSHDAASRVDVTKGEAEVLWVAQTFLCPFTSDSAWKVVKRDRPNAAASGVRGRISGLVKKGLLRVVGTVKNERGNPTRTFEVVSVQQWFFGG